MLNDIDALLLLEYVDRSTLVTIKEDSLATSPIRSAQNHIDRLKALPAGTPVPDTVILSFNQVALAHMQCGSPEKAGVLCQMALQLCFREYKKTRRAEWIVGSIQPLINLARLAAYQRAEAEPLALFTGLYNFVQNRHDLRVGNVLFNGPVYSILERIAPGAIQAVINAYVVDSIKALLSLGAVGLLIQHLDHLFAEKLHLSPMGLVLHESKVRASLMQHRPSSAVVAAAWLWSESLKREGRDPVVLGVLIDALLAANMCDQARLILHNMAEYAGLSDLELSLSQRKRLAYSLAIRSLYCDLPSQAAIHLDQARSYASDQGDQRMLCRVAILRYVLASRYPESLHLRDHALIEIEAVIETSEYARENAMARYVLVSPEFSADSWEAFVRESFRTHYSSLIRQGARDASGQRGSCPAGRHSRSHSDADVARAQECPISYAFDLLAEIAS